MKPTMKFVALTGIALALAVPALATGFDRPGFQLAQAADPATPAGPGPGMGMGMGMMGMHQGMGPGAQANPAAAKQRHEEHFKQMCESADARLAGKLAYAETRLKITEAQKPAWIKFTETAKAAHEPMAKLCTELSGKPAPTTLPDRLARAEAHATAHAAHLQKLAPAVKELYAGLTPEQQKIADTQLLGHHGMGGQGMHGHHGGW